MKSLQYLLSLILVVLFIIPPGEAEVSQTFCITPNETTECGSVEDCQEYHTLQYYSQHMDTTINRYRNVTVTIDFMSDIYISDVEHDDRFITVLIVRVIGRGTVPVTVN